MERAWHVWDGGQGDAYGLTIVLWPFTALWYRIAGAPIGTGRHEGDRVTDRRQSALAVIVFYALAAFGALVGCVVIVVLLVLLIRAAR